MALFELHTQLPDAQDFGPTLMSGLFSCLSRRVGFENCWFWLWKYHYHILLLQKDSFLAVPFLKSEKPKVSSNLGALFECKLHVTHIQIAYPPNLSRKPAMVALVLCLSIPFLWMHFFFTVQDSLQDSLKIMKISHHHHCGSTIRMHTDEFCQIKIAKFFLCQLFSTRYV